ncbi:MAG: hypothetical protein WCS97_01350 [Candidatus Paceibacterota bacterium]|jgi:hypothetical protein
MERITTIGPDELAAMPYDFGVLSAPVIPWSEEELAQHSKTHVLIFTPCVATINSLREKFGIDPNVSEPCFYNQDWYLKEDFANTPLDGKWHLIRKQVLEDARAKQPEEIEAALAHEESFSTAVTCAFAFFSYWFHTNGEKLWEHDFVWCSDRDHNGDRVYIGRYEDPDGVNKNGFNIHRHLALRHSYSAAPEIII